MEATDIRSDEDPVPKQERPAERSGEPIPVSRPRRLPLADHGGIGAGGQ